MNYLSFKVAANDEHFYPVSSIAALKTTAATTVVVTLVAGDLDRDQADTFTLTVASGTGPAVIKSIISATNAPVIQARPFAVDGLEDVTAVAKALSA